MKLDSTYNKLKQQLKYKIKTVESTAEKRKYKIRRMQSKINKLIESRTNLICTEHPLLKEFHPMIKETLETNPKIKPISNDILDFEPYCETTIDYVNYTYDPWGYDPPMISYNSENATILYQDKDENIQRIQVDLVCHKTTIDWSVVHESKEMTAPGLSVREKLEQIKGKIKNDKFIIIANDCIYYDLPSQDNTKDEATM